VRDAIAEIAQKMNNAIQLLGKTGDEDYYGYSFVLGLLSSTK